MRLHIQQLCSGDNEDRDRTPSPAMTWFTVLGGFVEIALDLNLENLEIRNMGT